MFFRNITRFWLCKKHFMDCEKGIHGKAKKFAWTFNKILMTVPTVTILKEHATYRKNELLIQYELVRAIEERRIGLRATEIYTRAKLSRPTFYLHCRNCDDALRQYEANLLYEFQNLSALNYVGSPSVSSDVSFTVLMSFIGKHQSYFSANFKNYNFYLLTILVEKVLPDSPPLIKDTQSRAAYLAIIESLILHWGKHDNFDT